MKRAISMLLSAMLLVGILAGCGASQPASSTAATTTAAAAGTTAAATPSNAAPQQKITINYWHSMGAGVNGDTIKAHVQQFNEEYAGKIEVIETYQGGYGDATPKIMQAIAANTQPEVVMMDNPRMPQFIDLDACEDLRPYFTKDNIDDTDYLEGLMTYLRQGDKIWGVPFNRSTPIYYYNKAIFKEVGLDPEKGPETWEDVKKYAAMITKKEGPETARYGIGFGFDFHWWLSAWVLQQGGAMLDPTGKIFAAAEDGTLLNALKFWDEMNRAGTYQKPASANAGTVLLEDFYQGKIGMIMQSTGSMGNILKNTDGKFEVGTCYLPKNKQYGAATGGGSGFILRQSAQDKKDAAWEFVKFVTSPEISADFTIKTGYVPIRKSTVETEAIKKLFAETPQYKTAYDQLAYAKDTFRTINLTEIHNEGNKVLQRMILEGVSPEQAHKEIAEMVTRLINQQ